MATNDTTYKELYEKLVSELDASVNRVVTIETILKQVIGIVEDAKAKMETLKKESHD